ncbi:MAG: hypothetical protein ACFCU5_11550 [Pleurocapsa sp.]
MILNSKILRTVWTFVETSNPNNLLKLSDREIVQQLIQQVESVLVLSLEDNYHLSQYIASRTVLIRDLADSKVV